MLCCAVAISSVTPIKLGSEGVVLEGTVVGGARQETLRAPCQVVNTTRMVLEVCLITVQDEDWQMVTPRAGGEAFGLLPWCAFRLHLANFRRRDGGEVLPYYGAG